MAITSKIILLFLLIWSNTLMISFYDFCMDYDSLLITKRIQVVIALVYLFTIFFGINRYEHFIKFNSFGAYKSLTAKQIVPVHVDISEVIKGRKIFTVMYQSEIYGSDTLALHREAMYVLQQIIVDADKQNANFATVSASSVSTSNNDTIS